jgi:site-specific recombinase XerD
MKLSTCLHQFFDLYLPRIKGGSEHTRKAYRDTFNLFLPFAAKYHSIKIDSLKMDHLSPELIIAFLVHLESQRGNTTRTRNHRLAVVKSLAKMIRFMYPEHRELAERILSIPQKRAQKRLIGFLYPDEIMKVFDAVDLRKDQGFRDYTILHLLYDSGARASEVASLKLDYFNPSYNTLAILGKGNRFRQIELWPITTELIKRYLAKYRTEPQSLYQHRMFINQRHTGLTRYGLHRMCKKYLGAALSPKRLKDISPAHSFRHSCAIRMISSGHPVSDIKNRFGHDSAQSTMDYLQLDLTSKRAVQKKFIQYTKSILTYNAKIDELVDWENREETLNWLDSL